MLCLRTAVTRPIVRRVLLEKPQSPSVPADIKAAAAAAAVGEMTLRDTRGPWMLIQTSSPVHVPLLVLAKLRTTSFTEDTDPEGDCWGPPLMADIVDAFSLRGPQDAFEGVREFLVVTGRNSPFHVSLSVPLLLELFCNMFFCLSSPSSSHLCMSVTFRRSRNCSFTC